jgi:hypothetical protein
MPVDQAAEVVDKVNKKISIKINKTGTLSASMEVGKG